MINASGHEGLVSVCGYLPVLSKGLLFENEKAAEWRSMTSRCPAGIQNTKLKDYQDWRVRCLAGLLWLVDDAHDDSSRKADECLRNCDTS
jgi:hypothetical protein